MKQGTKQLIIYLAIRWTLVAAGAFLVGWIVAGWLEKGATT